MKVLCINDSNRPNEIPINRWVKKDEFYTITSVCWMKMQSIYGCRLAEINNDDLFPYSYFAMSRFAVLKTDIDSAVKERELELDEVY